MSEQQKLTSEIIGKITKFFGWIAGITAGISAILSVTGYIVLQSHAHLLGISKIYHHTTGDYFYAGANFFINTLLWFLSASIIGNIYTWIVAAGIGLYFFGKRHKWFEHATPRTNVQEDVQEALQQPWVRWVAILVAVALMTLFILFALSLLGTTEYDQKTGKEKYYPAEDLLFAASKHPEIQKRSTEEGVQALKHQYASSALYILLSIVVLWIIIHIHRDPKKKSPSALLYVYDRLTGKATEHHVEEKTSKPKGDLFSALGRLFLYLLFLLQLALLPVQYGKTVYPNTFHRISNLILNEKLQGKIPQSQNIYLLNERDEEFVLYFDDTQEVSLVKKANVLNIAIKARENIFQ